MFQARVSRKLLDRTIGLPQAVRDIAWKGQLRMCQRYRHLMAAGKPKVVATTAIAREMAGCIRAIARTVTPASTCFGKDTGNNDASTLPVRRVGRRAVGNPRACHEPTMPTRVFRQRQLQDQTTVMRYPTRV
jgi:hypothetical protein